MNRFFTLFRPFYQGRRRLAAFALALIALTGWCIGGKHVITALNPSLKHELALAMHPALDVWISPPDYADAKPIIISTPAGIRFQGETLSVPEGSIVSAHLADQDGDAPELVVGTDSTEFTVDAHGDYAATQPLLSGQKLLIRRGWLSLAAWKIKIIPNVAPQVAMAETPSITESKTVRLSYTARDAVGIDAIALRITPQNPLPGADNHPVEIRLPVDISPGDKAKQIARVDYQDLTARPWAGQTVSMQIVATSHAGKFGVSDPVDVTLPERSFFHPVARMLIDERKKLLQQPDNEAVRDEIANIMADIARQTSSAHGDPVVMMALRSGAVRLVLDHDHGSAVSVNDMLWETAMRIEDGSDGQAARALRDARQDLASAIKHNADAQEIQSLTARLQQALTGYVGRLAARSESHARIMPVKAPGASASSSGRF